MDKAPTQKRTLPALPIRLWAWSRLSPLAMQSPLPARRGTGGRWSDTSTFHSPTRAEGSAFDPELMASCSLSQTTGEKPGRPDTCGFQAAGAVA